MGFKWLLSIIPYGTLWKRNRTLFQNYFDRNSALSRPVVINEVHVLLRNLTETPEKLFHHARRYSLRIACAHTFSLNYTEPRLPSQ